MHITKTAEGIYKLSTNIEDILFEGIWEIPHGVSLNSYVVKGEKTALIDGFCGWDGVPETFFAALDEMDTTLDSLDYIIINHMEPDHSGWIEDVKKIKDSVQIYCSPMSKNLLDAFYGHTENVRVVKDGDTLDLGGGRVIQFASAPNVHWPDAIVSFDTLSGTLFSCDIFGSYGSVAADGYDDALTEADLVFYEKEASRYYANIVGAFSSYAKKALAKVAGLPVRIIAPGHGLVWRKDPQRIVDDYIRYAAWQEEPCGEEITLLWGSMYGMTERAANAIRSALEKSGIRHTVHNVGEDSWGLLLGSVWNATGVILAMPTYENKMFPPMAAALEEIGKKKARNRLALRVGSYGWSGGAEKELAEIMERQDMGWDFLPSIEFKGAPDEETLAAIEAAALELVEKVRNKCNGCA